LGGEAHLSDLVQEQCPAVSQLEAAGLGLLRVGKGAFFVPEQFRFEEILGNAGTVHGDQGTTGAGAGVTWCSAAQPARTATAIEERTNGNLDIEPPGRGL